ncbi:MAG: phosphoenolpyruvate synthase [Candidatus Portnoybacteria bacterium]|nr:phosphoenolpyruvate synthase [Candidatus Portnoybacteria bacterium]
MKYIIPFKNIVHKDVSKVGGKNASLGEMISQLSKKGVKIPDGFATTAQAYFYFIKTAKLDKKIREIINNTDIDNITQLRKAGKQVRNLILKAELPQDLQEEIKEAYKTLSKQYKQESTDVAVRSSATAEDLPSASFAGQHETYLNVKGEKELLETVKKCFASLFTDRAISYRAHHGFSHFDIALSVGVQKMARSDLGGSGVMFTLDTESGFKDIILINASYGLGEMVVQGKVIPDEYKVFKTTLKEGFSPIISKEVGEKKEKMIYGKKENTLIKQVEEKQRREFVLTNEEIEKLAKWALIIEEHYSKEKNKWVPQDIEWAKDGKTGELFILQARPETVHAQETRTYYTQYSLKEKGKIVAQGLPVGEKIGAGKANVILSAKKIEQFKPGDVLVTEMTDPDWEPIMKKAAAIVTDKGGKTSHAAIVSRELGIPAIVGVGDATKKIKTGDKITIDCSSGTGDIYKGILEWKETKHNLKKIPKTKTKIMMNLGMPDSAFSLSFMPNQGVGLAREEFIIASEIQIHPLALLNYSKQDKKTKAQIDNTIKGYKDRKQYYTEKLAQGIGKIGAAFYPKPVIVRFSDFKTNEYASLIGGEKYEPEEENPMLGFRGASRYYSKEFKPAFEMECEAINIVREKFGLKNIKLLIPFCRTIEEGKKVLEILAKHNLKPKQDGLEIYVMAEIPSNIILADEFLKLFDGTSIGSNDLTQLTLGIDRDNSRLSTVGNENNEAVKELIKNLVKKCNKQNKYVGICGQAPSDYLDFARFLVENKIQSISLNPDVLIKTTLIISKQEKK